MAKRRARGEGTLYQRADGLWCAQITMPDGKRKTKYGRVQREVRDWLGEQRSLIRQNKWSSDTTTTVAEFVERYLRDVAAGRVRPQTLAGYQQHARLHIYPHIGHVRLSALRPDHVQALYTKLGGYLAPGTVRFVHQVLQQALEQAVRWGLIAGANPARLATQPTSKPKVPEILTDDQLRLVLAALTGHWLRVAVIIAIGTGLRRGEILALSWRNVDLVASDLHVKYNVVEIGNTVKLEEPKTDASRRRVSMPLFVTDALVAHRAATSGDGLVFPGKKSGEPVRGRRMADAWTAALVRAGVPHAKFHSLRHLHATKLLTAGVNPKVVQERLGHTSVKITLDTYSHVAPAVEREAADALQRTTAYLMLTP